MPAELNAELVISTYAAVFNTLGRRGSLDATVNRFVCEILDCDPHELDAILDANDCELRNEIACM